jgi:uncharacterized protein
MDSKENDETITGDKILTDEKALDLLKKYAPDDRVYNLVKNHSMNVRNIALDFAKEIKGIDLDFISTASLLHDIGRFEHPPKSKDSILHGIKGYDILIKEGLPKHAQVAKVHIGIGIRKDDIITQGLNLPLEDMTPKTKEEMIITYADNLDHSGVKQTEEWVEERFAKEISEEYRLRVKDFHKKIHLIKN